MQHEALERAEATLHGNLTKDQLTSELIDALKEVLASNLYLKKTSLHEYNRKYNRTDDQDYLDYSLPDFNQFWPLIEITLTFASVTIATSIINKVGEDLYGWLKEKLKKTIYKEDKKVEIEPTVKLIKYDTPLQITVRIRIEGDKKEACGEVKTEFAEEIAEAIKNAPQMLIDSPKKDGKKESRKNYRQIRYKYDTERKIWARLN